MLFAIGAAITLAAVMTFGDFVWEALHLRHRVLTGLAHGALMCLFIGAFVGARQRRVITGLAAGPVIGLIAAGGFYLLAPWLRYSAMFPMWCLFWVLFAMLQEWLGARPRWGEAFARGLAAAVLSGLAFWAISGIWTQHNPGGPDYVRNMWSWTVAFLPGFLCLFALRRPNVA